MTIDIYKKRLSQLNDVQLKLLTDSLQTTDLKQKQELLREYYENKRIYLKLETKIQALQQNEQSNEEPKRTGRILSLNHSRTFTRPD